MRSYRGKSVLDGTAIGRIRVYQKDAQPVICSRIADPEAEIARFRQAKQAALEQLKALHEKAANKIGGAGASIFDVHQILLADGDFPDSVESVIRTQQVCAAYAVTVSCERFCRMFLAMDDEYMKGRAADVKDISERLLTILEKRSSRATEPVKPTELSNPAEPVKPTEPVILVADDLTPSETVQLEPGRVAAFVTVHGSVNSHTAILARTMGLPALVGVSLTDVQPLETAQLDALKPDAPKPDAPQPDAPLLERVQSDAAWLDSRQAGTLAELDGRMAIVDGTHGMLYVDPDEETLERMNRQIRQEQEKQEQLQTLKGQDSVTLDGKKVHLCANIGAISDLTMALDNDAEGIGLFRSEFLYLGRETCPTEEEQFQVYRQAAEAMAGKRVVVRTMDIGADKQTAAIPMAKEENPALGLRGIRIGLTKIDLLKTQLRALYRASSYGTIAVMHPMITSVWEVRRVKELAAEVKEELTREKLPFGEVEQGIMIETPAAAVISDLLAKEVDFFSIGTNDLTQYLLAADRQNEAVELFYDACHPALLRLIAYTTANAHREHIRCGICGELAADSRLTGTFLAMGVDELSVTPGAILPLRRRIREMDVDGEQK